MERHDFSRRSLLEAIVVSFAVGIVPLAVAEIAEAAHEGHAAAQPASDAKLSLLSAAEAADVEAVAAQIVPTDDTPGARDAGVVYFIDRALATFLSQLAEFQSAWRAQHPAGASFASLTPALQVEYLKAVDQTPFFDTTRLLTLLGMFSLPVHGGNRGGVGWQLIGFEDRHYFQPPFGYYDCGYPGFVIDRGQMQ